MTATTPLRLAPLALCARPRRLRQRAAAGRAQRDHRAHHLRHRAHHRARLRRHRLRRGLRACAGQRVPDRRAPDHRARRALAVLRRAGHGPDRPGPVAQRADRPVHARPHGRCRSGAGRREQQRRGQGLAARLRGRLQPLPAGRRAQRPARGLPQQAVDAADVDGRFVAHHRDVDDPGRHRRAGRRRARGHTAGGDQERRSAGRPAAGRSRDRPPQLQRQPRRRRARLQRLGLRPQRHARRTRPGAGQSALPVVRHQPLLGNAPHHPGQARRDGRHRRFEPGGRDRLQQGRGVDAHGFHRQALHAVRAQARPDGPHGLHRRRPAQEDDDQDRQPARRGRRHAAEDLLRHRVGPGRLIAARRARLERDHRLRDPRRQHA